MNDEMERDKFTWGKGDLHIVHLGEGPTLAELVRQREAEEREYEAARAAYEASPKEAEPKASGDSFFNRVIRYPVQRLGRGSPSRK